ncbi:hypothetical protein SAMN04488020_10470 [Palleronia marisminoris]|uniref:DUF2141 domain-containing protein n=1 Tax=Palleronia marisminoris TaxID=315423 RepID=A0A1Y5SKL9_9RHOB|nr:hypothetical protein [Palleronia marisminoris]SFG80924.1 hypothetical protein SAMN04488020_10470 [Palleronia marisminoris]SLN39836.1 hypothetical protein PAM7066_01693 [Palleronia marisminoris]
MLRLALCLLLFGLPAWADPGHGLIKNRTGLPLTLPLQVKTDPGRDVYLVMRDAATTEIAVTAYIEGGRFFRLLMPPGTYTLHAAMGREWLGEDDLFGPETEFYTLPEALGFRAGMTRKRGHLIDLTLADEMAEAATRDIALCQYYEPAPAPERPAAPRDRAGSIAPEVPDGFPRPPGPRDPLLDGAPELGQHFGNTVPDIPLWQRLEAPDSRIVAGPDRDDRRVLRQRLCDPV